MEDESEQEAVRLLVPRGDADQAEDREEGHGRGETEVSRDLQGEQAVQGDGEAQERMIESQHFVMTNLRNGIDYLKATCKNAGELRINCKNRAKLPFCLPGEIQMNGCQWAEWAPWSVCSKVSLSSQSQS